MLQCGKYVGETGKNGKLLIIELVKENHNTIGIFNLFISRKEREHLHSPIFVSEILFWWLKTVTDSRKTLMKLHNRQFCVKLNLDPCKTGN